MTFIIAFVKERLKEKEKDFFFLNFFCFVFESMSMTNRLRLFFLISNLLLLLINNTTKSNAVKLKVIETVEFVKTFDVIETTDAKNDVLRF